MSADLLIRDLLLGEDVSGQVELLLNLISDAAAGRELSNVVSEVIQVGYASPWVTLMSQECLLIACIQYKIPNNSVVLRLVHQQPGCRAYVSSWLITVVTRRDLRTYLVWAVCPRSRLDAVT